MDIKEVQLHGGLFKFTLPYRWWQWLGWVIGLIMGLGGFAGLVNGDYELLFISAFGFFICALISPGTIESELHQVRKTSANPEEFEAMAEQKGLTIDSWFLGQSTLVPTSDPSDWVLSAPGPSTWDENNPYGPHGDGEPLAEHPVKVGTPVPATFSSFSLFFGASLLCILFAGLSAPNAEADSTIAIIVAVIGLIWLIIGYFRSKIIAQMLDTPTSLVRSMAVGNPELVGQVRPATEGSLSVVVDGQAAMTVHHMVGYKWTYEQYQCRTVKTDEGTKEECRWVTVRSDAGGIPFILHDGTGGVRVQLNTFKRTEYGQFLKRWDSKFAKTLGQHFMTSLISGAMGYTVKDHRWTLYGLKLGNPVYLLGTATPRPQEELAKEGLDGTLQNSILQVTGEDAPGIKSNLQRGTELANLGRMRSTMEMIIWPAILLLSGIGMLGLA